jgi:hypothetical protein
VIAWRRFPAWLGLMLAGSLALRAEAPAVAREPAIELPKFEVRDTRLLPPIESWRYAAIPGFEILSSASARETQRFTKDFLLLQEVIKTIMPVLAHGRSDVPTAVVLCGRGDGFNAFLPTERKDDAFSSNALFFENPERTAIVVDFTLAELQLDNDTKVEADPYRSFYREYFRFLVRRQLGPNSPPWLEEGLVQLFAAVDFSKKWIDFGMIGDGFGGAKPGDFNRLLARRWLMPFDQMFATEVTERNAFWSAQCYAFVHMCLYGSGKKYQKPLIEFVSRLNDEPASEQLFQQCFHRTYKQMAIELRSYLQFTLHTYVEFKAKKGHALPEPPPFDVREATEAEIGRIKGEILRLGGHEDEAHLALIAPYIHGSKDPRLLAALGLDEVAAAHDDRAIKFLEAATRAKVGRTRAYIELARLLYKAALGDGGEAVRLTPEQLSPVFSLLRAVHGQPPLMADEFSLYLDAWAHAAVPPTRNEFAQVLEGLQAFPRDAGLLMQAVLLASKLGYADYAQALAGRGVKIFSRDPAQRDRFQLLASAMARDVAPETAASPAAQANHPETYPAATDAIQLDQAKREAARAEADHRDAVQVQRVEPGR